MLIRQPQISYQVVGEITGDVLDDPEKVVAYLADGYACYPEQESFWMVGVDVKLRPIARQMLFLGGRNECVVDPRVVFRAALLHNAAGVIISHNHPSGDPTPSRADLETTRNLKEAGRLLGINLIDHVIVGDASSCRGYVSLQEMGELTGALSGFRDSVDFTTPSHLLEHCVTFTPKNGDGLP